jgi:hypothetical protein
VCVCVCVYLLGMNNAAAKPQWQPQDYEREYVGAPFFSLGAVESV